MRRTTIIAAALAAFAACGAQYPLNRVASVADMRPSGVGTNEVEGIVRLYDETNLTARIGAKQDALVAGANITLAPGPDGVVVSSAAVAPDGWLAVSNAAVNARRLTDNVCAADTVEYGDWDVSGLPAVFLSPSDAERYSDARMGLIGSPPELQWQLTFRDRWGGMHSPTPESVEIFGSTDEARAATSVTMESPDGTRKPVYRLETFHPAHAGEPFVTTTFVEDSVGEATRLLVSSNASGRVVLDPSPTNLVFGTVNLSNFVDSVARSVAADSIREATKFFISSNAAGVVHLDPDPNKLKVGGGSLTNFVDRVAEAVVMRLVDGGYLKVSTNGTDAVDNLWRVVR